MALDFPNNPTDGQTWEGDNGVVYTFNATGIGGGYWSGTSTGDEGGGNSNIHIGENPPVSPAPGDLWWDESMDSGRLYIYYQDEGDQGNGDSSQWVEASPSGGFDKTDEYWIRDILDLKPISNTDNVVIGGGDIKLNANGSADFGNAITRISNTGQIQTRRFSDDEFAFRVNTIGTTTPIYGVMGNGDVRIGGTPSATPSAANIFLYANGSAEFAGNVESGDLANGLGTRISNNGQVIARRNTFTVPNQVSLNAGISSFEYSIAAFPTGTSDISFGVKTDGSAEFANSVYVNDTSGSGFINYTNSAENSYINLGASGNSTGVILGIKTNTAATTNVFYVFDKNVGGSSVQIRANGSAVFKGTVQTAGGVVTPSMVLQLEADDDTKYTTTTDEEGNETRVYNGETLDVKALLLTLQTAASRIETLETANASLEARLTALEGA